MAPRAEKQLKKLSPKLAGQIITKIESLGHNPRPKNVKKLTNSDHLYRIRLGDYRVIYQIQDKKCIVLIVEVGHRKLIYKHL